MFQFFQRMPAVTLLLAVFLVATASTVSAEEADAKKETEPGSGKLVVFATVGDEEISMQKFQFAFLIAAKDKFYHGKPPQSEVAALQRQVGQDLVDRLFLVKEARKRGIVPNPEVIKPKLARVDKLNAGKPQWEASRDRVLTSFNELFDAEDMVAQLKKQVIDNIPDPKVSEVRIYYKKYPEQFTEPEKIRVHVILIKVDPSAPQFIWDEANHKATKVISRLKKGEDFAEMAREYSDDKTAPKGGDMGYVHKGTLSLAAQKVMEKLMTGEFSEEPTTLLEGIVILKRGGMIFSELHKFEEVKSRAKRLLIRELKEATWEDLKAELKKGVPIKVNEGLYLPF